MSQVSIFDLVYFSILFFSTFFVILHLTLWFENKGKFFLKRRAKALPKVSLIIPAYNEEKTIGKILKNIKRMDYPKNKLEVIVVDDGSKDKTYEIAKKFRSKRVKVFTKPNGGKSSALNFGIKKARGEFVAVVDADTFLEKDALKNCMKYFSEKKVAAVTTHILVSKKKSFLERMQNVELMVVSVMRKLQEFANIVYATPGPLSVYRIEDVEIAWRILKNGYKIKMAFDSFAYSIFPSSFKNWWKQRTRWVVGGLQTLNKYRSCIGSKSYGVGSFLVPTFFFGYFFLLIGMGIFLYLLLSGTLNFLVYAVRAYSMGINPFAWFEFYYFVDVKIIIGFLVFFLTLYLIKISLSQHGWRTKWYDIPLYIFVYPILYPFVTLYGIYKYFKGEKKWFTK
ncbi:glycosyltransferase [Candidatus Bathyarchaeota archaeon]|nr:glycosyltransferase [Candidatus Bathyarchaeota archaeon]